MRDRGGAQSENGEHNRGDAGLEADQNGQAAKQFDQADEDSGRGRSGQAEAGEPASGAGNSGQFAVAGENEQDGQENAADENDAGSI